MAGKEETALRKRWTREVIARTDETFRQRRIFTPFPPLTVGGTRYHDLRGLPIQDAVEETVLDHVDLSYARFEDFGQFTDVTATDCQFVGATLGTNLSGIYTRCRFDDAKLARSTIFGGSSFSACSFKGADLKNATAAGVKFEQCDFTGANFRSAELVECEFRGCIWVGAKFFHSSLGSSIISRAGFPIEKGREEEDDLLPDVILDEVQWVD